MTDVMSAVDILLVDDDEIDRELVNRLLGSQYQVREVATASAALVAVAAHRPDCILLDYRLPDTDGLQLLPHLRASGVPVIILTGEESPEIVVQAMQLGAQDYLVKGQLSRVALDHAIVNARNTIKLHLDLEQKNIQLRKLASELTRVEQRERRRVSQTLHDDLQQMLYSVQMRIHLARENIKKHLDANDQLQAVDALIRDAIQVTRTLTVELSPPMLRSEGLAAAFRWLGEHMAEHYGLQVAVAVQTSQRRLERIDEEVQVLLYQLVRELLFNVVKHAGVNTAQLVMLEEQDCFIIKVVDHGCGFDTNQLLQSQESQVGWGLHSMSERLALFDGELVVESKPGAGVCATIFVPQNPLPKDKPPHDKAA